jgi:hypothetical protein
MTMMFTKAVTAALMLLCAPGVTGFALQPSSPRVSSSSLHLSKSSEDGLKKMATSVLAAAFLMTNTVGVAPAAAMDDFDFGSSQVIAGRSGGRAGGRSSAPAARPSSSSSQSRSTTVINRTYVTPSPYYSSPGLLYAPVPMYNPIPGIGLGIGLNAIGNIGNEMRDYRQEGEIQRTRQELQAAQIREADMQARLRSLEMAQNGQTMAQQQVYQQQMAAQYAAQAAMQKPALTPQ